MLDLSDPIMVQGITGREASAMVEDMLAYGTKVVAGVTPGKGGQQVCGVPVFDTVGEAVATCQLSVSIIAVPALAVLDAALEAFSHGIKLCLILSERVPRLDASKLLMMAQRQKCLVIGPNTLGLIRPGVGKIGTIGGRVDNVRRSFIPGHVAVLSRSGGMTTEIASFLSSRGIGQSIAIGIGGDALIGADFTDLIELLEQDKLTKSVVIYGEPGGVAEERLAKRLEQRKSHLRINAFFSGRFVDEMEGVRFGHAAVMVEGGRGSVRTKAALLRESGVFVAETFDEIITGLEQD
ncbi:MAG: succinate--CoA ligase subunit alpha [Acidobacteriota bacterium]|nr:succinate--CoA ligase subunit alpha [Acidobacteriota bacterium]